VRNLYSFRSFTPHIASPVLLLVCLGEEPSGCPYTLANVEEGEVWFDIGNAAHLGHVVGDFATGFHANGYAEFPPGSFRAAFLGSLQRVSFTSHDFALDG
jgi:hypothetical protein